MLGGNCFNRTDYNVTEKKVMQSYVILGENISRLHEDITNKMAFGQEYICQAKLLADLSMLILFFKMIYEEKKFNESCDWKYYSAKYCLEKVKKAFYCRGVVIDEVEELWSHWGMNQRPEDGIGNMILQGTDNCYPRFRTRWDSEEDPDDPDIPDGEE